MAILNLPDPEDCKAEGKRLTTDIPASTLKHVVPASLQHAGCIWQRWGAGVSSWVCTRGRSPRPEDISGL